MYKQKESTITKKFLRWLKQLENCHAYKRRAGSGRRGWPDVSGCIQGIRIEIEVKRPGEVPTKKQEVELRKWMATGAICGWADNFEDLCGIVREQAAKKGIEI